MKAHSSMRISSLYHACRFCLIGLALASSLYGQEMSPALQKVWNISHSDWGGNNDERLQAQQELDTRPEFKTEFLAMLQRDYFDARKRGEPGDALAFGLLSSRKDLTPAEVKPIYDELATHVDENDKSSIVRFAIIMLSHYPSPEHEALVMRFLNRSPKQEDVLLAAFDTLSEIGGEKSLAAMREVAARLKAENDQYWFLGRMNSNISYMQKRLEHSNSAPAESPAVATANQPQPSAIPTPVTAQPDASQASSREDRLMWLGMVGGLILGVALACRAFRK